MKYYPMSQEDCLSVNCEDCVRRKITEYHNDYCPSNYCPLVCDKKWKEHKIIR